MGLAPIMSLIISARPPLQTSHGLALLKASYFPAGKGTPIHHEG